MNLIIDIGNSSAKLVAMEGDDIVDRSVSQGHSLGHLAAFLADHHFEGAILSSVVDLDDAARQALTEVGCPLLTMCSDTPVPIRNLYHTPATLGRDRLAAAVWAATDNPGRTSLVIDAGSCITYDLVSRRGEYVGGNIAPGTHARLLAIDAFFPRLPLVEDGGPLPEEGYDTVTAIRSGCLRGALYEMEGCIHHYRTLYDDLRVYLTGGFFADDAHARLFPDAVCDSDVVARGLNVILRYNHNKNINA